MLCHLQVNPYLVLFEHVEEQFMPTEIQYQSGFGNHFSTEALPGALPIAQNSPQRVKYGLYAEQLSGSAFTAHRHENLRTWFYRIRPSVLHSVFKPIDPRTIRGGPFDEAPPTPNQLRWDPLPFPKEPADLLQGLVTFAGSGSPAERKGCAVHLYSANAPMKDRYFYSADGELLFVPQQGALELATELGLLSVKPGEIAVIPRGIKFQANLPDGTARGYVCENYGAPFRLPSLGPIGANGLANPRDFETPLAHFEEKSGNFKLIAKFMSGLWSADLTHSPLDVVAWHGNYAPYKYDLSRFNTVNSVSFDHVDPSIFTVLTSPTDSPGTANVDFVIFPPRWNVAEHTFRPPYFHRNIMSEFMGLVHGAYDAKSAGFVPGGSSLHNCMSPHGPDAQTFERASTAPLKPSYNVDTLAFMFESCFVFRPTAFALNTSLLQKDYIACWKDLKSHFNPKETQER